MRGRSDSDRRPIDTAEEIHRSHPEHTLRLSMAQGRSLGAGSVPGTPHRALEGSPELTGCGEVEGGTAPGALAYDGPRRPGGGLAGLQCGAGGARPGIQGGIAESCVDARQARSGAAMAPADQADQDPGGEKGAAAVPCAGVRACVRTTCAEHLRGHVLRAVDARTGADLVGEDGDTRCLQNRADRASLTHRAPARNECRRPGLPQGGVRARRNRHRRLLRRVRQREQRDVVPVGSPVKERIDDPRSDVEFLARAAVEICPPDDHLHVRRATAPYAMRGGDHHATGDERASAELTAEVRPALTLMVDDRRGPWQAWGARSTHDPGLYFPAGRSGIRRDSTQDPHAQKQRTGCSDSTVPICNPIHRNCIARDRPDVERTSGATGRISPAQRPPDHTNGQGFSTIGQTPIPLGVMGDPGLEPGTSSLRDSQRRGICPNRAMTPRVPAFPERPRNSSGCVARWRVE